MKSNISRTVLIITAVMIIGVVALMQGCGGGGGGSAPAPTATTPTAANTGAGKLAAVVKLDNRSAGRSAGVAYTSSVTVNISITGVYSESDQEFPEITTSTVIDMSQGSARVPVLDVPVGVNHLLVVEAVWSDGYTQTLKALIPEIEGGVTSTVTADQASTALAEAALYYATQQGIRLVDVPDDVIAAIEEAIAALVAAGTPYSEIQPSQVQSFIENMGVLAGVSLNAPTGSIVAGNTFQFTGEVLDANGTPVSGATVTYTFSDAAVGAVDANGLFTAVTAGSGVVTAAFDTLSATASVTVIAVCAADADCDDGIALTLDSCSAAGTASAACVNTTIACNVDIDCDDANVLTVDACNNGGTATAACANTTIPCNVDLDCDDANAMTVDVCENGGTLTAACANTTIPCNVDIDCDDADALTADTCANGGTLAAVCANTAYACNTSSDCAAPTPVCLNGGGVSSSCIACAIDTDCDDADTYTIDTCSNPNTVSAVCNYVSIACLTTADCDDADANTVDTCYNPGVASAVCGHSTNVSMDIDVDTTWSLAGSPYIVENQIAVYSGTTLTIDPGVEVWYQSPTLNQIDLFGQGNPNIGGIYVDGGILNAVGTVDAPITMTIDPNSSVMPGGWGGLYYTYGATGTLSFVNMDYAAYPIQVEGAAVSIDNVNITNVGAPMYGASYHIYTKTERGWVEQAVEHYGMRYESRAVDLSGLLPDADGEYKVRIQQTGMHAAHVDSVELALDGRTYRVADITGASAGDVYKLTFKDNDVFDAHEKTFDVRFDASGVNTTPRKTVLYLNAREESKAAIEAGKAFTYPRNHFYDTVDTAAYYTYTMGTSAGALRPDGEKSPADALPAAMFTERTTPMSGHPEGNAIGYVKNDGRYLYAALDFTPDNTYDGDADFASVYVRVGSELKRFRVSVPEQQYGAVGFTYTDAVNYQHKYYEFKIPLSEIGSPKPGEQIELVFDAYGTASLFTAAVSIYSVPTATSISNLSIAFEPGYSGSMNGLLIAWAQVIAENITITGAGTGIYALYPGSISLINVSVTDSVVGENLYVSYGNDVYIADSEFLMAHTTYSANISNSIGVTIVDSEFSFSPSAGIYANYSNVEIFGSRFQENCGNGISITGDQFATNTVTITNSNIEMSYSEAVYGDYYAVVNLDGVYMNQNAGASGVETATDVPDSLSAEPQYYGITSIINPMATPNAVIPNASGTQYCWF